MRAFVAVSMAGNFSAAGNDFLSCYRKGLERVTWDEPSAPVGDGVFSEKANQSRNADSGAEQTRAIVADGILRGVTSAKVPAYSVEVDSEANTETPTGSRREQSRRDRRLRNRQRG